MQPVKIKGAAFLRPFLGGTAMAKAKKLPSGKWRALVYDYTDSNGKRKMCIRDSSNVKLSSMYWYAYS